MNNHGKRFLNNAQISISELMKIWMKALSGREWLVLRGAKRKRIQVGRIITIVTDIMPHAGWFLSQLDTYSITGAPCTVISASLSKPKMLMTMT